MEGISQCSAVSDSYGSHRFSRVLDALSRGDDQDYRFEEKTRYRELLSPDFISNFTEE
jgi:hypothetical protein